MSKQPSNKVSTMQPKQKKQKTDVIVSPSLNPIYLQDDLLRRLRTSFCGPQGSEEYNDGGIVIKKRPFAACVLSNLLNEPFLDGLIREVLQETWFTKRNDLYEFYVRCQLFYYRSKSSAG